MHQFSAADLLQSATGTAGASGIGNGVTSATVTLPAGTTEGSTVVVVMRSYGDTAIGQGWERGVTGGSLPGMAIFYRPDIPVGETSWVFNAAAGGQQIWAWKVEEWTNIEFAPLATSAFHEDLAAASTLASGNTGSVTDQFVLAVGGFSVNKNSSDANNLPTISGYTGGFVETDQIANGPGTTAGDLHLAVARYYGADSETGPFSCTVDLTGSLTSVSAHAAIAVFRAATENIIQADAGVLD